jgi:hypothetical protein
MASPTKLKRMMWAAVVANLAVAAWYIAGSDTSFRFLLVGVHTGVATWVYWSISRNIEIMVTERAKWKLMHGATRNDDG